MRFTLLSIICFLLLFAQGCSNMYNRVGNFPDAQIKLQPGEGNDVPRASLAGSPIFVEVTNENKEFNGIADELPQELANQGFSLVSRPDQAAQVINIEITPIRASSSFDLDSPINGVFFVPGGYGLIFFPLWIVDFTVGKIREVKNYSMNVMVTVSDSLSSNAPVHRKLFVQTFRNHMKKSEAIPILQTEVKKFLVESIQVRQS